MLACGNSAVIFTYLQKYSLLLKKQHNFIFYFFTFAVAQIVQPFPCKETVPKHCNVIMQAHLGVGSTLLDNSKLKMLFFGS